MAAVVVAGLYAGGMTAERQTVPAWVVGVSAVAAVVTGVPVLRWLRPRVDALLFAHPQDARDLIADVGQHLARRSPRDGGAGQVATEIAEQVARRLRLPWVAIVPAGSPPPEGGPPSDLLVRVPLVFGGEGVGELLLQPRPGRRDLSVEDQELLAELAVHVGIALHATQVTDSLRASRAALVSAREEERRRIRRDLHDGLGPTLASLRLHLAALQQLIPARPEEALALVSRLREEVRGTSGLVRGLVYDLRPPALDELGLAEALRARAAEVAVNAPAPLRISCTFAPELGLGTDVEGGRGLPAAVEVALLRIGSEALTNIGRHAGAERAELALTVGPDSVRLVIEDDGRGLPPGLVPGVGHLGMAERAEELGGTLRVGPGRGGGCRVEVVLPLDPSLIALSQNGSRDV